MKYGVLIGLVCGFTAGVWLQHRWPLGRLLETLHSPVTAPTEFPIAAIAKLPPSRRLVLVASGQSNAANYVEGRALGGAGVYAFTEGKLFAARDPLPGGDGRKGSIWTRLGALLAAKGEYQAVVIAVAAQGSTQIADWTPGGSQHAQLVELLRSLSQAGLPADFILWQQGESDAINPAATAAGYEANVRTLVALCREQSPSATFLVAQSTAQGAEPVNEQIRAAQVAAAKIAGAGAGPDTDQLGAEFRHDGVHFNAKGASAAARLWLAAIELSSAQDRDRTPQQ